MKTGVKAPILILSALAFLAGCKSEPLIAGPKFSYLRFDDDSITFVQWAQRGRRIRGAIEVWAGRPEGEVKLTMFQFDGVLDGENVSMALNPVGTSQSDSRDIWGTITGALRGNNLMLPISQGAGVGGVPPGVKR